MADVAVNPGARVLTLADVRLAALRVALAGAPLVLFLGLSEGWRGAAAGAAFAAWGLGPVTLVERFASRRGLSPLDVGLLAGVAAAVCVPVALAHALVIGRGLGPASLPAGGVDLDDLLFCVLLGVWAGVPVAGATFVHVAPLVAGRPVSSRLDRWLFEPLLALAALVAGVPLLAVYACAEGLELLLVGSGPALARTVEALPDPAATGRGDA